MNARPFVCGTRAVVSAGREEYPGSYYKVVCATCGGGGNTHYTREKAITVAVRDSAKPCKAGSGGKGCGAR